MRWYKDPYNGGFGDFSQETDVYAPPTPSDWRPTAAPTMQPTVYIGVIANFEKVGGTNDPPASALPFQICQGDCDSDDDVSYVCGGFGVGLCSIPTWHLTHMMCWQLCGSAVNILSAGNETLMISRILITVPESPMELPTIAS